MISKYILVSIILTLLMIAPISAEQIEIRSEIANGDITYDYRNAPFLWMDIDSNLSSEVIMINTTGRFINDGDLIYTCVPKSQTHENPALGTYEIVGFLGSEYVIYDYSNELSRILESWDDNDEMTLAVGDSYLMPDGIELKMREIDLDGNKVYAQLLKDGVAIDAEIITNGGTYKYEVDDVLIFSVCIDSVFRGTESNFCQITYIWLISEDVMKVESSDTYGELEVCGTNPITLKNDGVITLDPGDEIDITDELIIRVADNDTVLLYYLAQNIEVPACPESETVYITEYINVTEPCPVATPEIITVTEYVNVSIPEEPANKSPGMEGIFAIAGILAVVWLIARQRD